MLKALSPEQFSQLCDALDGALGSGPEEQAVLLGELERTDPAVATALRELLTAKPTAQGFLETRSLLAQSMPQRAMDETGLIGQNFGPYRVLSLLGHGGMGSVWLAERADGVFRRTIALKLVHPALMGGLAGERFAREREILAGLTHPNIARLLDAGFAASGQPYLALEYVAGVPITRYCDEQRMTVPERLRLFAQVLAAVQYAHSHLVIHRDLKPANILVTAEGDARLLDFGIAKLLAEGEAKETELTQLGGRALTPDYAAPEQIVGAPITIAADVYALGIMLYELLTGQRPYQLARDTRGALEEAILGTDPVVPSRAAASEELAQARGTTPKRLGRILRGDLDTIVLKALKKTPGERYATVAALAEDLERYLRGEPVLAQRDSVGYRTRKFVRRHRLALGAAVVFLSLLLTFLAVTVYEARVAAEQRDEALRAHLRLLTQTAATRLKDGDVPGAMALVLELLPLPTEDMAQTAEELSVFQEARAADTELMVMTGHTDRVTAAAYSPDGRRIATASYDKSARLWDATTGLPLVTATGHDDRLRNVAFSADGRNIVTASADRTARIWDATTGQQRLVLSGHDGPVVAAAFSPDGARVATASVDKTARIWNAATGQTVREIKGHTERVNVSAFFPAGDRLLTASDDRTARIWEVTTGREVVRLTGHSDYIENAALSADGQRTVTASFDKSARVWDNATGRQLAMFKHSVPVVSASFSPDGSRVVVACFDKTARVLDSASGDQVRTLTGHTDLVLSAAFSPDGRHIVTSSSDRTARVWDSEQQQQLRVLAGHDNRVPTAEFSRDGRYVVTSSYDKSARVWDARTGRQLMVIDTGMPLSDASFSPDGRRLVVSSDENKAAIWDLASGRLVLALTGHTARVNSAQFSPDGRRVVTSSNDRSVRIWDVTSGRQIVQLNGHTNAVFWAIYSPDGRRIVTASNDGAARVWDADTGRQLLELVSKGGGLNMASFSPDGQRIATASVDGTVSIWDARVGNRLGELRGHRDDVFAAVFAPDGRRVATSSVDRTARIWDSETGQLLAVLTGHLAAVNDVEFSPDGKRIITASDDGTARMWDAGAAPLATQIAWAQAAQFDELPADERTRLGLPARDNVRGWEGASTACDAAAAAPYDPERRAPGVMTEAIVADIALQRCGSGAGDVATSPQVVYQRGRALAARGDLAAARRELEDARARGYRAAQVDLASILLRPDAGSLDVPRAVALLEHAWADGLTIAGFELGRVYEHGVTGGGDPVHFVLAADSARAWSWYEKAAQAGDPSALARLAERADRAALEAPDGSIRDERWLTAFRGYAAAAERARVDDWPDDSWRAWRYRRASLARLLEQEGMMREVAQVYAAVHKKYAPAPAPTMWTRLRAVLGAAA